MLDNHRLDEFGKKTLKFMPYESRINIYDKNCLQCPYHVIRVRRGESEYEVSSLQEAITICINDDKSNLVRACSADAGYSLWEITSNTCSLWYPVTDSIEDFEETYED
jgi:hypothetical protein